jgi:hypothetical protein
MIVRYVYVCVRVCPFQLLNPLIDFHENWHVECKPGSHTILMLSKSYNC